MLTNDELAYDGNSNHYTVSEAGAMYTFANPDFSFREFRSNLVPALESSGPTMYVLWAQGPRRGSTSGTSRSAARSTSYGTRLRRTCYSSRSLLAVDVATRLLRSSIGRPGEQDEAVAGGEDAA